MLSARCGLPTGHTGMREVKTGIIEDSAIKVWTNTAGLPRKEVCIPAETHCLHAHSVDGGFCHKESVLNAAVWKCPFSQYRVPPDCSGSLDPQACSFSQLSRQARGKCLQTHCLETLEPSWTNLRQAVGALPGKRTSGGKTQTFLLADSAVHSSLAPRGPSWSEFSIIIPGSPVGQQAAQSHFPEPCS